MPDGKSPAISQWQRWASLEPDRIRSWWRGGGRWNVGIATGLSGLVVVDLDQAHGANPPERFRGARNGLDVLKMLADAAGAEPPTDTYTAATPSGGMHLYFQAPDGITLRCTTGQVGWRIDTRAHGGYVIAAGSKNATGTYEVIRDRTIAELPTWLARALAPPPPPPEPDPPLRLPTNRASRYVNAIVANETDKVTTAETGTRHVALLKAARTLGRLVAGGELARTDARQALQTAAAVHVGIDDWTAAESDRTINDGLAYGLRLPRQISQPTTPSVLGERKGASR